MRTATITLGGVEYEIQRMPAVRAIAWRKRAQGLLERFPTLAEAYQQETDNLVTSGVELFKIANGLVEELIEVVLLVDPKLDKDRERILDSSYEEEFLEAYQQALLLNSPLQGLAQA